MTKRDELVRRLQDARQELETVMNADALVQLLQDAIADITAPTAEPVAVVRRSMTGGNVGLARHVEITADFLLNDGELLYTHPPKAALTVAVTIDDLKAAAAPLIAAAKESGHD